MVVVQAISMLHALHVMHRNSSVYCTCFFFSFFSGKKEIIKVEGLVASTLIIDSKQGENVLYQKKLKLLCLRDLLAMVWVTPLEFLETQFTKMFRDWESKKYMSEHVLWILHWISSSDFERASKTTLELLSMKMQSKI